ncbi:MAG: response regulator transcription factor [Lachnospiraceae bacterium]|nr:response regulator transcription factor [Lachnospiraceae bacterium]
MEEKLKILFVEDDHALAMGTEYALEDEGMAVWHVEDFGSLRKVYREQEGQFDLALLDVMLPDADGYEVFSWMQEQGAGIPVIFLTALDDEGNVVRGLSVGASDYVTKPFRMKELIARIRANVRKMGQIKLEKQSKDREQDGFYLDEEQYCLRKDGEPIELTPSEFRLLRELMRHQGQVLTREQLINKLWSVDEAFIDGNTLSVYIRRIREKIDTENLESHIKTVRGVGYMWQSVSQRSN